MYPLDIEQITRRLRETLPGTRLIYLPATDSTNLEAKRLFEQEAPEKTVVVAETQSAGRGRRGRSWESPPGTSLTFSVILTPQRLAPDHIPLLALVAGLAMNAALRDLCPAPMQLKWPNDLLIQGKKVCGILAEYCAHKDRHGVIVGIGINVNQEVSHFSPELVGIATSLHLACGHPLDRTNVFLSALQHLDREYRAFLDHGPQRLIRNWMEHSKFEGEPVTVRQGERCWEGRVRGLDPVGNLLLKTETGEVLTFKSGEVSLRSQKTA